MERRGLDGSRNNTPAANSGGLKRHWGMELLERLARSRPPMAMVTWNGSEHPVEGGGGLDLWAGPKQVPKVAPQTNSFACGGRGRP